jgi:peptide/nickel transport system substrate-binding protein
VTAEDFLRGIKRTCNPIQPFGAIAYLTGLIEGMQKFCDDFQAPYAKEGSKPATAADVAKYVEGTKLTGVEAPDDQTVVFHLLRPASYFVDMMALSAFSPAPVEVLKYAPGSAELGQNQISDGPYQIDKYDATKTIELSRNPAWDSSTDPVRKAWVDKIVISETGEQSNIQKQLELGDKKADMAWDTFPLATDVPGLLAKKDKNLTISPTSSSNPFLIYNWGSPNNGGAMAKLDFRQGLSSAINRDNILQVLGGKTLNAPLTHVLPETILGGAVDSDLYPNDLAKAKSLFKKAGVPSPTIKVLYRNESNGSTKTFETLQSDLAKAGIKVVGVSASNADFYTKYLQEKSQAQKGVWDIAIAGWGADWYGNSALSYFLPLYAGTSAFPPNGSNYGLYNDDAVNKAITAAGEADIADAEAKWAAVDKLVMEDAAYYPLTSPKTANYHAKHLHGAVPMDVFQNYDPTNVWIEKSSQE